MLFLREYKPDPMRYLLLLVLLLGSLPVGADDGRDSPLHVVVFYAPRCRTCRRMKEEVLPKLAKAYPGQIVFDYLDADLYRKMIVKLIIPRKSSREKSCKIGENSPAKSLKKGHGT